MRIIGITGGVGAGKSTVLALLKELSPCEILMADTIAKDMMIYGKELSDSILRLFGKDAYGPDLELNREYLASCIFQDSSLRKQWENIVHPAVKENIRRTVKELSQRPELDFVFLEAALLIEDHYQDICQEFWYIYASEEIRTKRLIADRGYSPEKIRQIFASQSSEAIFSVYCSRRIDTGISLDNTRLQLENALDEYR